MAAEKFEGELKKIDPSKLVNGTKPSGVDVFFLVLASIYNDFKGLAFFHILISDRYAKPESDETTYHAGEYGGYFLQLYKSFLAMIHELLKFLQENERIILSTGKFSLVLNELPSERSKEWKEIVGIALGTVSASMPFTKFVERVRNNVAFHYYESDKNLKRGFISHFYQKEKKPENKNEFAYYAIGKDLKHTRFFYADAALQDYLFEATQEKFPDDPSELYRILSSFIPNMNSTLFSLLRAYIKISKKFPNLVQ